MISCCETISHRHSKILFSFPYRSAHILYDKRKLVHEHLPAKGIALDGKGRKEELESRPSYKQKDSERDEYLHERKTMFFFHRNQSPAQLYNSLSTTKLLLLPFSCHNTSTFTSSPFGLALFGVSVIFLWKLVGAPPPPY